MKASGAPRRESTIQRDLRRALAKAGALSFKAHGSPYMPKGISDVICCWKGRFLAFEVKRPGGEEPTALQLDFVASVWAAGGYAFVINNVCDALELAHAFGD